MTKSIVEDIFNASMTRDMPKIKLTLTHQDLDQMLGDVAECLEAQTDLEKDRCEVYGKELECLETIEVHKWNQHGMTSGDLGMNMTSGGRENNLGEGLEAHFVMDQDSCNVCGKFMVFNEKVDDHKKKVHINKNEEMTKVPSSCKDCENNQLVNNFKDKTITRKDEVITMLGEKLRKMSLEKRAMVHKLKTLKSKSKIEDASNGVEENVYGDDKYKCKKMHIHNKHNCTYWKTHCNKTF